MTEEKKEAHVLCVFCGAESKIEDEIKMPAVNCPCCGKYNTGRFDKHKTKCYLYHNKKDKECAFLRPESKNGWNEEFKAVTETDIDSWYPETRSEKIKYIKKAVLRKYEFEESLIAISAREISTLFFVEIQNDGDLKKLSLDEEPLRGYRDDFSKENLLKIQNHAYGTEKRIDEYIIAKSVLNEINNLSDEPLFDIIILPGAIERLKESSADR